MMERWVAIVGMVVERWYLMLIFAGVISRIFIGLAVQGARWPGPPVTWSWLTNIWLISTNYYKQFVLRISICLLMFSRSICCASIFNLFSSWYFWNIACSSKKTKHLWGEDVLIFSVIETEKLLFSDLPKLPPDPPHGCLHVGPGHCSPAGPRLQ